MARTFRVYSAAATPTAAPAFVALVAATAKSLIQIKTPAAGTWGGGRVVEWGIYFDTVLSSAAKVELVEVDVAATITAYVAADIVKRDQPQADASLISIGSTTNSGFAASAEGTPTVARLMDFGAVVQAQMEKEVLGREAELQAGKFYRVRVTSPVTANALAYIEWEE